MNIVRLLSQVLAQAAILLLVAGMGRADDLTSDSPIAVKRQHLKQCFYLAHTSLVEASTEIGGNEFLLEIKMSNDKRNNTVTDITVWAGSERFTVPVELFRLYGISACTHLFELDKRHIGFVLFRGDGERAMRSSYRVNLAKRTVRREDWYPNGKLAGYTQTFPLSAKSKR